MQELWNGRRVPVTLLGGVLGSGKTTLLNRLLAEADGRRLVVLVNDVGDIAVDAALIASATDDVIELTNGCVCCSMTDGLGEALEDLRLLAVPPDQVVVELSGVAEPARVAPWVTTTGFRLEAIVVCVDADRIGRQLSDRWLSDTVRAQLRAADLVALTKTDLVSTTISLAPHTNAPVIEASQLPIETLLAAHRNHALPLESGTSAPVDWVVTSVHFPEPIEPDDLGKALSGLPSDIIRLKGFVGDRSGACWLVQGVGDRRELRRVESKTAGGPSGWGIVAIATPTTTVAEVGAVLLALREACSVRVD